MAEATLNFPRRFQWGTATSAHQVEGNNNKNNWWVWEQEAGRIKNSDRSGLACDWWGGRWKEDFDRAADTGQTVHRLSIEWSRVQPEPNRWNEDAIDHYRQMARGLRERGIRPLVTLHHFSDPLWLSWEGGWTRDHSDDFRAYVEKMVKALREYVDWWCTFNEPNVYATMGYVLGHFPPGQKSVRSGYQVMTHMLMAHAAAYEAIHRLQPEAQVGLAHHYRGFNPRRSWSPIDQRLARWQSRAFNDFVPTALHTGRLRFPAGWRRMPGLQGTQDYFGLNYYTEEQVGFSLWRPGEFFSRRGFEPGLEVSPGEFIANAPDGFTRAIRWALAFGLPVVIAENGVEDAEDQFRPKYLARHVHKLWHAINFNWPIQAYFHWSLVDNFEWERGWSQRFGLWALDTQTQGRTRRASANFYEAICQANALSSEMVANYAASEFLSMFPNT
jgi:beta-glucosidase